MGKAPQFRNFDLAIGARDKDGFYSVSVLGSPAGETTAPVPIPNPQSDAAIVTQLAELHDGIIAAPELQALGQRLMNFLLPPGPVQDLFAQSVLLAASQDARIRMRLRIAAQELATLPWEYAFHPGQGEFLALDSTIAVLRYHSQPMPPRAVTSLAPLPLLIVGANPAKLANLKAADEIIGVISSISPLLRSGRATVDILFGGSPEDREEIGRRISGLPAATLLHPSATIDAVRNTLRGGHRMLHFIGHGAFTPGESGLLLLLDEAGDAHPIAAQTLARELRDSSIAVVLLNACQGAVDDTNKSFVGVAPGLVRAGIPAVIAMQGAISDKAALRFSQGLYAAIADGWPLDAAVTQGRLAISSAVESSAEWGIPVLFMRSSDGVLWVEPSSVSPAQLAADFGRMIERVEQAIQRTNLNGDAQPDLMARGVQRYTQGLQTLMQHAGDSGASGPYKGLLEYRLQDAELFAGRAAQTAGLLEQIQRGPLTILHSESGAGKTSLLQAGVAPRLIAAGHLPVLIRPYNVDPALALKRVFIPNLEENPDLAALPVGEFLARACRALGPGSRMFVFVDQFEEFFTELHPDAQRAFVAQLARCVDDPLLPVHWVFAMRREYFSRMEMFRPQIRNPFGNDFLLLRLTMDEAREAITQPAARFGITWDRELVEALLSDLGENEIAPPQAQLVCQALIDELAEGNTEVTRTLYGRLGGASGILRGHLERVLTRNVPPAQRRVAHAILEAMVTSDSRRVMASREDLVAHLAGRKLPADGLDAVLAQLVDSRLVRTSERDAVDGSGVSETAFELAHDYLAERIELDPDIQSRKAAQELLNRELLNWQAVGAPMDERTLAVVAAQREWLRLDRAAQALLLTSALANDIDLTPWLQAAPEDLARQVLLDGLASAEASQRARAIAALVGLADQSTAEVLAGVACADASAVVRDAAFAGLQQIDPQRARHELLAELAMPDPARRAHAATALRFDVDQEVAARLFTLTTQDDDQAVWQAALATLATSAAEPQRMGWRPLLKAQAPRQVATRRALRELGVVLPGRMEIRIWPARAKTYLRQEARSRPVWLAVRAVLAATLVFLLLAWWQSWPPFGVRWVRVAGSPQAEINTLEVAGERVYAGSLHYGVSRRDGDGAWSGWLNQGLPTGDPGPAGDPASIVETIRDLAVDSAQPDTVYALVDHHGLYMSADAGQSWAPIDIGIAITNTIGMAVAARDGVVLVAANDQGLFGSRDAGATWQQLSGQGTLPTGDYKVARYSPEGTPYVGGLNGLFRGTGQFPWTWERLEGLAPVWALDTGPNGRLYLAQGQGRPTAVVCFDPNQGQRIAGIFDDDAPIAVRASLEDPEMVYVGAVKRVYHLSCQAERTDPLLAVRLLIAELQGRDIVGTADLAWLDGGAGGYDLLQAKEDGIFAPAGSSR